MVPECCWRPCEYIVCSSLVRSLSLIRPSEVLRLNPMQLIEGSAHCAENHLDEKILEQQCTGRLHQSCLHISTNICVGSDTVTSGMQDEKVVFRRGTRGEYENAIQPLLVRRRSCIRVPKPCTRYCCSTFPQPSAVGDVDVVGRFWFSLDT